MRDQDPDGGEGTDRGRSGGAALREELDRTAQWGDAIFECSRDAIFISNNDSCFTAVNRAACDLTGFSRSELLGMRISDLHDHMDAQVLRAYRARVMAGEQILTDASLLRKDGTKVAAEFSSRRLVLNGTSFMYTSARDVTERDRVAGALRESGERYRALFEDNPLLCFALDAEGNVVSANRAGAESLGYAADELVGHPVTDFYSAEDRAAVTAHLRGCLDGTGGPATWQLRKLRRGGGQLWVREFAHVLPTVHGTPGVLVVGQDVTGQVAHARRVQEHEKLVAVGRMSAAIVHEVKNPLFAISSGIQLLMDELSLTQEQRETFEIIYKDVRRMDRLVQQLDVLSSQRQLRKTEQPVVDLVREALTLHRGLLAARSVRIVESFERDLPTLLVDRDRIHQVVINLLQNAIAVSPQGGEIEVGAKRVAGRPAIAIHVRDRGPGVPEELRARIFEPFFTTKQGSAGLGLSICSSIAQDHGGSLEVCDHPDGGAVFTLELPLEAQP